MSNTIDFSILPKPIQAEIFLFSSETRVAEVCKDWNNTWTTTAAPALLKELASFNWGKTCLSEIIFQESDTVPTRLKCIFSNMFKKAHAYKWHLDIKHILKSPISFMQKFQEIEQWFFNVDNCRILILIAESSQIPKNEITAIDFIKESWEIKGTIDDDEYALLEEEAAQRWKMQQTVKPLAFEVQNLWNTLKKNAKLEEFTVLSNTFNPPLRHFPSVLFQFPMLKSLMLSSEISYIPPEIQQFSELTALSLSSDKLTAIPPELGKLTKLQKLHIIGTKIETLPPELSALNCFPELTANPIVFLPKVFLEKAPAIYKEYFFDLDKDLVLLKKSTSFFSRLLQGTTSLPIRLQKTLANAMQNGRDHIYVIERLEYLQKLKNDFIEQPENQKLSLLKEMMQFPTEDIFFKQQIIDAIFDAISALPKDSKLRTSINKSFGSLVDFSNNPEAGLKKFLMNPLDPSLKKFL